MIRVQNFVTQSIKRLEAQMSQLVNIINDRNAETLSNQFLTIPYDSNHITKAHES